MYMEMIQSMIRPELLVLVPVLYLVGGALKRSRAFDDRFIPLCLGGAGAALALMYLAGTVPVTSGAEVAALLFTGMTQGVLCAGCSVYVNQIVKQYGEDER